MRKHTAKKHKYLYVGGGCMLDQAPEAKCCDEEYRCSCGSWFMVRTTRAEHVGRSAPMQFVSQLEGAAAAAAIRRIIRSHDKETRCR